MRGRLFGGKPAPRVSSEAKPESEPATPRVSVVRTMTMPGGKKIRVMRKDAFERSIRRERVGAPA